MCRKTIFVIEFVKYWRFLRKVYNKYLCISKSGMLYKKEWYSATPPFPETILKVFWLKIERGKVKNIREDAYSPTGDIFLRDTAYFIVIQWSIRSYIIESQWNLPYPVWKCVNASRTGVRILPIKKWNVSVIKLVKYWRLFSLGPR